MEEDRRAHALHATEVEPLGQVSQTSAWLDETQRQGVTLEFRFGKRHQLRLYARASRPSRTGSFHRPQFRKSPQDCVRGRQTGEKALVRSDLQWPGKHRFPPPVGEDRRIEHEGGQAAHIRGRPNRGHVAGVLDDAADFGGDTAHHPVPRERRDQPQALNP